MERNARAPCQRLKFYGSKAIDVGIDCLKLSAIFGAEKLSAGYAGDLAERCKIDPVFAGRVGIAKADCVDDEAFLSRDIGGMFGWNPACRIISIDSAAPCLIRKT